MADLLDGSRVLCLVGALVSLNLVAVIGTYLTTFDDVLKYKVLLVQFILVAQSLLFFAARYVWVRVCPQLFTSTRLIERIALVKIGRAHV